MQFHGSDDLEAFLRINMTHLPALVLGLMLPALTPVSAQGQMQCRRIFEESVNLRIDDLGAHGVNSKLKESLKLQLAFTFQTLESQYGPLALKPSTAHVDWARIKPELLRKSRELETTNDQYYLMADLLASFNDGHVSITLPSDLSFRLPLQLRPAEGRLFVNYVKQDFPSGKRTPDRGDEILEIDGQHPADFQKKFLAWNSSGNDLTNAQLFGLTFGNWREAGGLPLSKMTENGVRLRLRSAKTGEIYDLNLDFKKEGMGLVGMDLDRRDAAPEVVVGTGPAAKRPFSKRPGTAQIFEKYHKLFRTELPDSRLNAFEESKPGRDGSKPLNIGELEPFFKLPDNFKPITLTKAAMLLPTISKGDLMAGTFVRGGKKVGFLRIPSYGPENLGAVIPALRYYIHELNRQTDYLVIDQTNNPGGYVLFSDLVVKALTGKFDPSSHLHFAVKPSQNFLRQYLDLRNSIARNDDKLFTPAESADFVARLDVEYAKIRKAFDEGRNLSEPVSMLVMTEYFERAFNKGLATAPAFGVSPGWLMSKALGVDITKDQVYEKPVYFMINELDFSGGDATPASLQDYGRVKLVGMRTAGAGGTVEQFSMRGILEFEMSLTTSLMVRTGGRLVENYGVQPDIVVPLRASDIADGYVNYFENTMKAIDADMAK